MRTMGQLEGHQVSLLQVVKHTKHIGRKTYTRSKSPARPALSNVSCLSSPICRLLGTLVPVTANRKMVSCPRVPPSSSLQAPVSMASPTCQDTYGMWQNGSAPCALDNVRGRCMCAMGGTMNVVERCLDCSHHAKLFSRGF